jgi:hypothetical protein
MDDRTCDDCGKQFPFPSGLKAHQQRKTPCRAKVEATVGKCTCKYCGRGFAYESGLYKHITQSCKLAKTGELAVPARPPNEINLAHQIEELKEQLDQLVREKQAAPPAVAPPAAPQIVINGTVNTGPVTTTMNTGPVTTTVNNVINQHITITPWGKKPFEVPTEVIVTVFGIPQLAEHCCAANRVANGGESDPDQLRECTMVAYTKMIEQVHKNPASRNIYLNPSSQDQAMVYSEELKWEPHPIDEATRIMFDTISDEIFRAIPITCISDVPEEMHNGVMFARMEYKGNQQRCIEDAKKSIVAHLTRMRPTQVAKPKTK